MWSNQRNFSGFHLGPGYYLGLYPEEWVVKIYLKLTGDEGNHKKSFNFHFTRRINTQLTTC